MGALPGKLQRAEADFIIMDYTYEKSNLETQVLGREKYVAIGPKNPPSELTTFLDNNSEDLATVDFFKAQKAKAPKYSRAYYDDCYGIIDGVSQGLGFAVMPEHLIKKNKLLKVNPDYKAVYRDIVLHYHKQPFYSKLHREFIDHLTKNSPKYLA